MRDPHRPTIHCDSGPCLINSQNTPVHDQLPPTRPTRKPPPQPNPTYDPPPKIAAAGDRKTYTRTKSAHNSTTKTSVRGPNRVHPRSSRDCAQDHSECALTSPDASRLSADIAKYAQHLQHVVSTMRVHEGFQGNHSRNHAHARLSHSCCKCTHVPSSRYRISNKGLVGTYAITVGHRSVENYNLILQHTAKDIKRRRQVLTIGAGT